MRRAFSVLLFPVLLLSISHHVAAQATGNKTQPPANLRTPKEPVRSASVVLPPSPERQAEARKLYEEGVKLTEEGQHLQAAESFQQAVRLNSEYADAYSALGRAYFKMRLWQKAIDNLRRAAELNTKHRQTQEARYQESQLKKPQASNTPENAKRSDSQLSQLEANSTNAALNASRPELKPTPPTSTATPEAKPKTPNANAGTSALRANPPTESAPPKTVVSQPQSPTTNSTSGVNLSRPESKPTPQPAPQQVAPKDAALAPTGNAASSSRTNQTSTTVQSSAPPKFENESRPELKPTPPTSTATLDAKPKTPNANSGTSALRANPPTESTPPKTVVSQPQSPTTNSTSGVNLSRPESKPTPQPAPQQVAPKDAALAPTGNAASSSRTNQTSTTVQSSAPPKFENESRPELKPTPPAGTATPENKPKLLNANAGSSALSSNPQIEPAPPKTVSSQPQSPTTNSTSAVNTVRPESKPAPQPAQQQVAPKDAALAPIENASSSRTNQTSTTVQSSAPPKFEKASLASSKTEGGTGLSRESNGERVAMSLATPSEPLPANSVTPTPAKSSAEDISLTKIYRVGPNDVLDVRVNDPQSPKSTLFTITSSGLLEHPLFVEPLMVTGLTVEEIGIRIENDLKSRALIENPKVIVGVRDYGSHSIIVSGLIKDSGTKFLMREAIPLYVVVADAQPLPEAARVTVVRNQLNQLFEIDLTRAADMNLLVRPGDVLTFQPNVTQFVYIGGEVKNPGEKTFRRGLTLTQVILTAGGVTSKSTLAQIARDDGGGFLVETSFNMKDIVSGKTVDPLLKPGDRISILR